MPPRSSHQRTVHTHVPWARLSVLFRVVAILLGVQLSGVGHTAADAMALYAFGVAEHEDECPLDGACDDCPAGCPSCHCSNGLRTLAPESPAAWAFEAPDTRLTFASSYAWEPARPDLPSLYRPPRA